MKINLIAQTKEIDTPNLLNLKDASEDLCGKFAGVCYMKGSYKDIKNEPREKTISRVKLTKENGHHSVFDHIFITLQIEGVSKALTMVLNNLNWYNTSEKSGRYTQLALSETEQILYDKWLNIFQKEIKEKFAAKNPRYFTDSKCLKLAQENARCINSVYSRGVVLVYTISYRQLNYIHGYIKYELEKDKHTRFFKKLIPELQEFAMHLEKLPHFDDVLSNHAKYMAGFGVTGLNIINECVSYQEEYFGSSVYSTNYQASLAQFAEQQRHRTISYSMCDIPENPRFFIPYFIENDKNLVAEWLKDLNSVAENVPIGTLFTIYETGTLQRFLLKCYERKCSCVLVEFNRQIIETTKKYYNSLLSKKSPMAEVFKNYMNGSRCTFKNYKCTSPCGFKEGIDETRLV